MQVRSESAGGCLPACSLQCNLCLVGEVSRCLHTGAVGFVYGNTYTDLREEFFSFYCPVVWRVYWGNKIRLLLKSWFQTSVFNRVFSLLEQDLLQIRSYVYAEEPNIDIHNFLGTFTRVSGPESHLKCVRLCWFLRLRTAVSLRFLTEAPPESWQVDCSPSSQLEF